jgi:predicted component of type VI protein secretion system
MQLVVQAGAQCGQVYKIEKDSLTIGRGASNDITFADPAMSRVHCEIRLEGDDYVVEDRHSANGTFVNDEQIELPFLLRPGDTIRLGQTVLLFQEEGVEETTAAGAGATSAAEAEPTPSRPWVLIGGIVGIAILILAFAFVMSNRAPESNIAAIKTTAPPAPSETRASVPSPAPTEVESPTSSLLPTATVLAATQTAVETAITPATPTATDQVRTYPIPVLSVVLPAPQTKYSANSPVPFNWIAVDILGPNDIYRVQVSTNNQFNTVACEIRTRETYVTIPGEGVACNTQWQFGQHYYWRVHIIPRDASYTDPVASAETAPISEFTWGP